MQTHDSMRPGTWSEWHSEETPLRIGVSTCLLGEEVRFDGGHARDRFVTDRLGEYLEFVPVCPEVEAGLGVPRPTVRLVRRVRSRRRDSRKPRAMVKPAQSSGRRVPFPRNIQIGRTD